MKEEIQLEHTHQLNGTTSGCVPKPFLHILRQKASLKFDGIVVVVSECTEPILVIEKCNQFVDCSNPITHTLTHSQLISFFRLPRCNAPPPRRAPIRRCSRAPLPHNRCRPHPRVCRCMSTRCSCWPTIRNIRRRLRSANGSASIDWARNWVRATSPKSNSVFMC